MAGLVPAMTFARGIVIPAAPVFIDSKNPATVRGPTLATDFKQMVSDYIERRFGQGRTAAE